MMIDLARLGASLRLLSVLVLCGFLAACSTGRAPTAKPQLSPQANLPEGGIYKVGNPYQIDGVWYYPSEDYSYVEEGIASWYGPDFHGKRTANGERYDMNALTAAHPTLPMPSVVNVTNLENGRQLKLRINDRGPFKSKRVIDISRQGAQLLGFKEQGTTRVRVEIDRDESLTIKNQFLARSPGELPKVTAAPRATVSSSTLAPPQGTPAKPAPPPRPVQSARAPEPELPKQAVPGKAKVDLPGGTGVYIQAGAFSEPSNAQRLEQQLREFGNVFIVAVSVAGKQLYRVRLGPLQDDTGAEDLLAQIKTFGYEDAQIVRF
jgi:rare lipoprotein A